MNRTLLERILTPGCVRIAFQPIYRLARDGRSVYAVEALVRGPVNTNIASADVLFEYVRRRREEVRVDYWCIQTALAEAARLPPTMRIHLNVHACTLSQGGDFLEFLRVRAGEASIALDRLTMEIVEHGPAHDMRSFLAAVDALRKAGVRVALDDVGMGFSNFRTLVDCHADYMKLDRAFVHTASRDPRRHAVLEAMTTMARRIGATPIAEGVELAPDLAVTAALGISLVQGYLFAHAMSSQELVDGEGLPAALAG